MDDTTHPDWSDHFPAGRRHHTPPGESEGPGPWRPPHGPHRFPFHPGWQVPHGGFGGPGRGMRGRMRRGDVRAAILALLLEQPRN